MALVRGRRPEEFARAMEVIQNAEHSVAFRELEVMEVVGFRGYQPREVIAAMYGDGVHGCQGEPKPHNGYVTVHQHGSLKMILMVSPSLSPSFSSVRRGIP